MQGENHPFTMMMYDRWWMLSLITSKPGSDWQQISEPGLSTKSALIIPSHRTHGQSGERPAMMNMSAAKPAK